MYFLGAKLACLGRLQGTKCVLIRSLLYYLASVYDVEAFLES